MSAFWIFFACLTAAYVIYYAVIVGADLWAKPQEQRRSSEESFELEDSPEDSRAVVETDGGFRVGSDKEDRDEDARQLLAEALHGGTINNNEEPDQDEAGAASGRAAEKIESIQSGMEEVEAEQSTELVADMLRSAMLYGRPPVEIDKTVVPAEKDPSGEEQGKEVEYETEMRI